MVPGLSVSLYLGRGRASQCRLLRLHCFTGRRRPVAGLGGDTGEEERTGLRLLQLSATLEQNRGTENREGLWRRPDHPFTRTSTRSAGICQETALHHHEGLWKQGIQVGEQAAITRGSLRSVPIPQVNGGCGLFLESVHLQRRTGRSAPPRCLDHLE